MLLLHRVPIFHSEQIAAITTTEKPRPPKILIVFRRTKRAIRSNYISIDAERENKLSISSSARCKIAHTRVMYKDYSLKCTMSFNDREFTSASPTDSDVIIVGAGVAGSALAYTLGKVNATSAFVNNFNKIIKRVTGKTKFLEARLVLSRSLERGNT